MMRQRSSWKTYVDIYKILLFDPKRPETFTVSPLINDVLIAISEVGLSSPRKIAKHLGYPSAKLWAAVELITGYNQHSLRMNILLNKLNTLSREHPEWSSEMLAKAVGYSSRAALYNALGKEEFDEEVSNLNKEHRYSKNRVKKEKII